MAKYQTTGVLELESDFNLASRLPEDVKREMLKNGGEIIKEAQRRNAPKKENTLANSLTIGHYKFTSDGGKVDVYFDGIHHTSPQGPQPNGRIANVLEYGTKDAKKPATQFIRKSNEESVDEAIAAEYDVYSAWLSSHNL